jgi:peroxiredoxin Q/BCP
LKPEFDAKNAVICGVSFDTVEENRAFRQKFDYPYALLCDTEQRLGEACGAVREGGSNNAKRITVVIGDDGKVRKVFDTVSPAEHPQEVLASL